MDRLTAMSSFVRVIECGSFAAAASAADLSPAMIGNHIRFLEAQPGEPLLKRSSSHLGGTCNPSVLPPEAAERLSFRHRSHARH